MGGPKHFFYKMDGYGNGDGQVTFKEFTLWKHSAEEIDEAKPEFERLDSDDNGSLTLKEYLAGLSENADEDKDTKD